MVAVAANIESLHRMTREERDLRGLIVSGSDHLTAYNVYAEAVNNHGYLGEVYGLPRPLAHRTIVSRKDRKGTRLNSSHPVTSYAVLRMNEKQTHSDLVCRLLLE